MQRLLVESACAQGCGSSVLGEISRCMFCGTVQCKLKLLALIKQMPQSRERYWEAQMISGHGKQTVRHKIACIIKPIDRQRDESTLHSQVFS